jgi:nucleoside-diphosphate-sugar epimerase
MQRDFTYIDDVVAAMSRLLDMPPARADRTTPDRSSAPFRLYNIGNHTPVRLQDFLAILERHIGARAVVEPAPMQPATSRPPSPTSTRSRRPPVSPRRPRSRRGFADSSRGTTAGADVGERVASSHPW